MKRDPGLQKMHEKKEAAKRTFDLLIKLSYSRSPNFPGVTYKEEAEVVKQGTKVPSEDRKTRREIPLHTRFALSWLVRLVRHLRTCRHMICVV